MSHIGEACLLLLTYPANNTGHEPPIPNIWHQIVALVVTYSFIYAYLCTRFFRNILFFLIFSKILLDHPELMYEVQIFDYVLGKQYIDVLHANLYLDHTLKDAESKFAEDSTEL